MLTKIDLINPGGEEEVLSVVNNVRKPLKLGYIMVKNRSQLDLNNKMTTLQARYVSKNAMQSDCHLLLVTDDQIRTLQNYTMRYNTIQYD